MMRNRAKCKLCESIIESYHISDYVMCKCGKIAVDGGDQMKCYASDWSIFIRVDDEGNEIIPTVKEKVEELGEKPDRDQLLDMLSEMVKSYERLPEHAMLSPVTQADLCSALILLLSIFRSERNSLS